MREPTAALDLDLAIAERARQHDDEVLDAVSDSDGGFFGSVLFLLRRAIG